MAERAKPSGKEIDRHPLEADGVLEGLVETGRIPALKRAVAGPEERIAHVSVNGRVRYEPIPGTRKTVFFALSLQRESNLAICFVQDLV